jgi:hypothetical protein
MGHREHVYSAVRDELAAASNRFRFALSGKTPLSASPDNVQETGVSPVDGLDPAWWPRRRSRSSELKKDLVTGPI